MRSAVRLKQSTLFLRSDSNESSLVHERLVQYLAPLWSDIVSKNGPVAVKNHIVVSLHMVPDVPAPEGFRLFRTRVADVHWKWSGRQILHFGSTLVTVRENRGRRHIRISAKTSEDLFESGWATLLSVIGEDGDRAGWHRVHALGIQMKDQAVLLFSSCGIGKSTLCERILANSAVPIYGDEIPLVNDQGKVACNPLPIALHSEKNHRSLNRFRFHKKLFAAKDLIPIPKERWALSRTVGELVWLTRRPGPVGFSVASRWEIAIPLFRHLVIGEGVPQMAEFFLRAQNMSSLMRIFCFRFWTWGKLLLLAETWILNLNDQSEDGWRALSAHFKIEPLHVLSAASRRLIEPRSVFDSSGNLGARTRVTNARIFPK